MRKARFLPRADRRGGFGAQAAQGDQPACGRPLGRMYGGGMYARHRSWFRRGSDVLRAS
jgi:hypothetical protein